jgi:hypothetical protein
LAAVAFPLVKGGVALPECSTQAETQLGGFPTILMAGRFNLRANPKDSFLLPVCREICTVCRDSERPAKQKEIKHIQ